MIWLSDARRELLEALGVRRYVIGGIVTLALTVAGAISLQITGTGMTPLASAFLVLIVVLGFILFCVLDRCVTHQRKRTPKIEVFLDRKYEGVETFHQSDGTLVKYVQLSVRSVTEAPLFDCQVRLRQVERVNDDGTYESLLNESMTCDWSKTSVDASRRTMIQTGDVVRANLFFVKENPPHVLNQSLSEGDMKLFNSMMPPGCYRLTVSASAQGISARPKQFILSWGGSFDAVSIKEQAA
jgi:hypothetical protein